jgi:hypothetical protein
MNLQYMFKKMVIAIVDRLRLTDPGDYGCNFNVQINMEGFCCSLAEGHRPGTAGR